MKVRELLRQLDFGNSVAEFDDGLDSYFVATDVSQDLSMAKLTSLRATKGRVKPQSIDIYKRTTLSSPH